MSSNNSRLQGGMKSSDNSTKPSTNNCKDNLEEPIPSFMKALHSYQSDILSSDENDFLNETFSKSSGGIVIDDKPRFSDISSKSFNRTSKVQENNYVDDES